MVDTAFRSNYNHKLVDIATPAIVSGRDSSTEVESRDVDSASARTTTETSLEVDANLSI